MCEDILSQIWKIELNLARMQVYYISRLPVPLPKFVKVLIKKFSKILYGGKSCLLGFFSLLTFIFLKFFSLFCLASSEVVLFVPTSGKIVGGGRFQNQKFICAILELLQYILKKKTKF